MDCPTCGTPNPPQAKFCLNCATPLAAAGTAPVREERKVVSVVFADLVGFTARAESLDPEDVERILRPYHDRLRTDFERWGGTVEKFIGDAVMAVFGAPVAHEDDAERAVRAALAIRDWAREQDGVELRIAVNTGEALVNLSARPEQGQSMVKGDVVNTAARLQAAAPVNSVLVGATTYRATSTIFDYKEAEPVVAKGKAEPVPVWEVIDARSAFGVDVRQLGKAPLVGRQRELGALIDALNRSRSDREPQLVTLVGAPGMGKSRLLWELFQRLDAEEERYTWRQGRSLPIASGVAFWALGEIVKAQTGIFETDDPETAADKLDSSVRQVVADVDQRSWVGAHLRPLVGLGAKDGPQADRGEVFAAWRRYLEGLAENSTVVIVFEDLHWADDGLLDFVDYLSEWVTGVPMLLVGTTRPELLARRPDWGGGKSNTQTLSLTPLSDEETTQLVHSLFERSVLPVETQQQLLDQAGGNPLYAEEFVRLAQEGGLQTRLPENVQAIISARIDALAADEKRLLQQAAVLGKVFWLGGVVALSGESRWTVEERLHRLDRRDFVRQERRSSVAAETEFAFRHALVRDAAYEQLPRGERAELHRRAAGWIESLGRAEDTAEMLAHHYVAALEYARAAGQSTEAMVEPARVALKSAGERALSLSSFGAAQRFYAAAIELATDNEERPSLLFGYGRALQPTGDARTVPTLEEASAELSRSGEPELAAEAELLLANTWWYAGDRAQTDEHLSRAQDLIADIGRTPSRASVLSEISRRHSISGRYAESISVGEQAIALARELNLPEVEARALTSVGTSRFMAGNIRGLDELELSLDLARKANSPEAGRTLNNLAVAYWLAGDIERGHAFRVESAEVERRYGRAVAARFAETFAIATTFFRGRWDLFLTELDRINAEGEAGAGQYEASFTDANIAIILAARGDDEGALAIAHRSADWGRQMGEPQALLPGLTALATVALMIGNDRVARQTVDELVGAVGQTMLIFLLIPVAALAPDRQMLEQLRSLIPESRVDSRWFTAYIDLLDGNHERASDLLDDMGVAAYAAISRTEAAARLAAAGRHAEADALLRKVLTFWRSVGATRYIRRAEALLSKAG